MQPIADLYVELAERVSQRLGSLRVRALHLPPVSDSKDAEFCALELEDGSIGFSYIQLEGTEASLREHYGKHGVSGADALAVARGFASDAPVERALGVAAINALSQSLFTRANWAPPAGDDPLGAIDPQADEHIGMIGLFTPLLSTIERSGARLTVLELKQSLVRDEPNLRVTLDPAELASCVKIVSTGTIVLNDTIDAVFSACRNARYFAMVGPTVGCAPDPLFARGVNALGGRRVVDRERFLAAFRDGGKWGAYATKYVVTRENYPGTEELMSRVG